MAKLNLSEGTELVHAARNVIELSLKSTTNSRAVVYESVKHFSEPLGVFVTLSHYPTETLRGCIGFPKPVMPLGKALIDSALAAAFEDPRFVPISFNELPELLVEVNVLSEMHSIEGSEKDKLKMIKIGRDGLMIEYGIYSGLLLPEVAIEEKFNAEDFLNAVCEKAGIAPHYWKQKNIHLFKFTTQAFKEIEPYGKVEEIKQNV